VFLKAQNVLRETPKSYKDSATDQKEGGKKVLLVKCPNKRNG